MKPLYALSFWQPWASWVAQGKKRVENRKRAPPANIMGQWLAIHASKRPELDDRAKALAAEHFPELLAGPQFYPMGGIIGLIRPVSVMHFDSLFDEFAEQVRAGNLLKSERPWFFGPVGWAVHDACAIELVPCQGQQGYWPLGSKIQNEVFKRAKVKRD